MGITNPNYALGLTFFSVEEADIIEALASRIVPGTPDDPGAREAGVVTYIDRALAGFYQRWQAAYRRAVIALTTYVVQRYGKKICELSEAQLDELVARLEQNDLPGFHQAGEFFWMLWNHTIEGMFSDPAYGGNRDLTGWKLMGFPGAQYGYSAEDMQYGSDLSHKGYKSLADVEQLIRTEPQLFHHRHDPRAPRPADVK